MIAADPTKLTGPRRAREEWEQLEREAASGAVAAMRKAIAEHFARGSHLVVEEIVQATLAGLVQGYFAALETTHAVDDEAMQARVMRRALVMAEMPDARVELLPRGGS
jgi:hypothetical protein